MQVMGNLLKYTCAKIIRIALNKLCAAFSVVFSYGFGQLLAVFLSFLSIVGWGKFKCT